LATTAWATGSMSGKDKPASIAFVVAGLGAGGAERVIALLTQAWIQSGREVCVISFDNPADPVYHQFDSRVRLMRLGVPQRGILSSIGRVMRLRAALRRQRPAIVISFLTKINVITLLASIALPVRVVVSERNNPRLQPSHVLWSWLVARLYPRAAGIVIQTESSRSCLPAAVAAAAVVIPNPLARTAVAVEPGAITLSAVGRLEHQKGFDLLLQAVSKVLGRHPGWRLCIWGEGPLRKNLETQIAGLGLTGQVILPGLSDTPGGWLATTGAFVLSSRYEGFPNALGEAMAAGLPVAAFDCDFGPSELIRNNNNGLLIPNGDVDAMAMALDRLLGDAALRRRLGAAARATATGYAPEIVFAKWQAAIQPT
jgi:glycosyltransferase involved in cell wall biosynthesis